MHQEASAFGRNRNPRRVLVLSVIKISSFEIDMILLRKPDREFVRRQTVRQASQSFTYEAVGATNRQPPYGYVVDHNRARLGNGEAVFDAAKLALRAWKQFHFEWVEVPLPDTPIQVGEIVPVLARVFGLWSLNFCRIVSVIEESGPISRFGLAYGTLPDHVESGEERFLIEWDRATGEVSYDILAFSRPNHILARLGYPLVRRLQKRFARESILAMRKAVEPMRR